METTEQEKIDFCRRNCPCYNGEVIHRIDCVIGLRERLEEEGFLSMPREEIQQRLRDEGIDIEQAKAEMHRRLNKIRELRR